MEIKNNQLKHGQFKIKSLNEEHIINHPSQNELAEGWQLVIPNRRKNSTIHHFSINLSQLPQHLWKYLCTSIDNTEYYRPINDGIYQYSVKKSNYDDEIQKLYNFVNEKSKAKLEMLDSLNIQKNEIIQLYNYLEQQQIKGWLMIRVKDLLNI
jgi:hypothetical protein